MILLRRNQSLLERNQSLLERNPSLLERNLSLLERIRSYPSLVLIAFYRIGVVFETDTIAILIRHLACIIHRRILVNHRR